MRRFVLAVSLLAALAVNAQAQEAQPPAPPAQPQAQALARQNISSHLQDISVTIVSRPAGGFGGSEGSGVIVARQIPGEGTHDFIWTAAHVVSNLRHTREVVDSKTGSRKTVVEFDDPLVVKALLEDGRMVGKTELYAEVIRYSADEDLALLRLRKKNFINSSAKFYLDEQIPPIGTKLLHVGSLLGQLGSNSMTTGIMSQHGRLVGLVLRGAGETFNLIAPVRRIHTWAKRAGIEWAAGDKVPVPGEAELEKLPVEDNGVDGNYSPTGDAPQHHKTRLLIRELSGSDCADHRRYRKADWIRIQLSEENLY